MASGVTRTASRRSVTGGTAASAGGFTPLGAMSAPGWWGRGRYRRPGPVPPYRAPVEAQRPVTSAARMRRLAEELADERVGFVIPLGVDRSEEHTSELQSLMRNSYAVFFLKK